MNWKQVNNLYNIWVSENNLKKYFSQKLYYNDYSLWWSTKLVGKDNMADNNWYFDLFKILNKKKIKKRNKIFFWLIFLLKTIKNFVKDLTLIVFSKLFFIYTDDISKCENCFHSYYYNFVHKKNTCRDRLYEDVPYIQNKEKNFYIISLQKISMINLKKLNLRFVILEKYLTIFQLLDIYFKTLINLIKLIFFLNSKKNLFYINGVNCENILKPLLLESFSGFIQFSLINAQSINNILKKNKNLKNFISYGEFTPGYRSIYFFIKKINMNIKITSIQHGNFNENILYCLNHKSEFSNDYTKHGKIFSPMPDQMMLKGKQAKDVLKKYFRGKIKIIGSISDNDIRTYKKSKIKKNSKKKIILICPSIGDHILIEKFFEKSEYCKNLHNTYIISPHPVYRKKVIKSFKRKFEDKMDIQVRDKYSSFDLIKYSDLVICSFSSLALKAKILGKKSVRLVDNDYPIFHSPKDQVLVIKDSISFDRALNFKSLPNDDTKTIKKLYSLFYYKNDKNVYTRFWKSL